MDKITLHKKIVKCERDELLAFLANPDKKDAPIRFDEDEDGKLSVNFHMPWVAPAQDGCKFKIPGILTKHPSFKEMFDYCKNKKSRIERLFSTDSNLDINWDYRNALVGWKGSQITDDVLKKAARNYFSKTKFYCVPNRGKGTQVFEDFRRGNPRYQRKMASKVQDCIQEMENLEGEKLILTATCDPKKYNGNRLSAWKGFSRSLSEMFQRLRRYGLLCHVEVHESTKQGYPHAHCILMFKKGAVPDYNNLPVRKQLRFGYFVEIIKRYLPAAMYHLEKPATKSVKYYLSKYFTKTAQMDLRRLGYTKRCLSGDERKAIFAVIYAYLAQVRLFNASRCLTQAVAEKSFNYMQGRKQGKEETRFIDYREVEANPYLTVEEKIEKVQSQHQRRLQFIREFKRKFAAGECSRSMAGEARLLLIQICNNPHTNCFPCRLVATSYVLRRDSLGRFDKVGFEKGRVSDELRQMVKEFGYEERHCGCIFSELRQFVFMRESEFFTPKLLEEWNEEKELRLFHDVDLRDDFMFFRCMFEIMGLFEEAVEYSKTAYRQDFAEDKARRAQRMERFKDPEGYFDRTGLKELPFSYAAVPLSAMSHEPFFANWCERGIRPENIKNVFDNWRFLGYVTPTGKFAAQALLDD